MKSGFITVVGLPNVGKSSLTNSWVGENVSIVTSKPQTTRKRTLGICAKENQYQVIFVDTPGYIEDEHGLNKFLKIELEEALKDVNGVVAAMGHWEFNTHEKPWALQVLENSKIPILFVITQSDKIPDSRNKILDKWKTWTDRPLIFTSAKTQEGLNDVFELILRGLPEGPEYYDMDIYTTQNLREISSECVRKSCFENLHQEIPYGLAVQIRDFKEESIYKIHADIILNRESHKPMVIGQGGVKLKAIGTQCRQELEKLFGKQVFLKLHVAVKPQWMKNQDLMEELGYVKN